MNHRFYVLLFALVTGCFSRLSAQQPDMTPQPVSFDSLPVLDSLNNRQIAAYSAGLSAAGRNILGIFQEKAAKATFGRIVLDSLLLQAKKDTTVSKSQVADLTAKLKEAKNAEKSAIKLQKQAEKSVASTDKLAAADTVLQRKQLGKAWQDLKKMNLILYPPPPKPEKPVADVLDESAKKLAETPVAEPPAVDTAATAAAKTQKPVKQARQKPKPVEKPGARFKQYDPAGDVMLNPPSLPSTLAVNVRDEFSGEVRKEVTKGELFQYTNPVMRKYLQGKTHITCDAALGTAGLNLTLTLTYTINDPNARKAFGGVGRNAVVMLKMIDGTTITGYNARPDEGTYDPATGVATYRPQYTFDKSLLRKLKTTEIDKLRMAWSTGYEDYEVQQIDLLMRQAKILE
jgi:hypothetical protein